MSDSSDGAELRLAYTDAGKKKHRAQNDQDDGCGPTDHVLISLVDVRTHDLGFIDDDHHANQNNGKKHRIEHLRPDGDGDEGSIRDQNDHNGDQEIRENRE
jgi:hypothetical protein